MQTSIIYGFGFPVPRESEKMLDFIKDHEKSFCQTKEEKKLFGKLMKYKEGEYDIEDLLEDFEKYECENSRSFGLEVAISNIISRETNIRFEFRMGGVEPYPCILLPKTMPWQYNEAEKNLQKKASLQSARNIWLSLG